MDRRVGNTKKMGALFGILAAIGGPIPEPETIPYAFFILSNRLSSIFSSTLLPQVKFSMSRALQMLALLLTVSCWLCSHCFSLLSQHCRRFIATLISGLFAQFSAQ